MAFAQTTYVGTSPEAECKLILNEDGSGSYEISQVAVRLKTYQMCGSVRKISNGRN